MFFLVIYGDLATTSVRDVFTKVYKQIRNCYDRLGKQHEGFKIYYDGCAIVRDLFPFYRKGNRIYYSESPNHRKLLEHLCNPFAFSYERLQIVYDSLVTVRELFCVVDEVLRRHCDRLKKHCSLIEISL